MWPFRPKQIEETQDTTEQIWIGNRAFPLQCDNAQYEESVKTIKTYIGTWITQEIDLLASMGMRPDVGIINTFRTVDIRMLGWSSALDTFEKLLEDTAISVQGARFEDLILRISLNVPTEVMETITGKFLYGVLYRTRQVVNKNQYPDKEAWELSLIRIPWLPILPFIQEVMDTEQTIKRISNKVTSSQMVYTTNTENRFTRSGSAGL